MNTRIETDFNFLTAVHFEDIFYTNAYDVTLSMLVETDSIHEQNGAINRVEYFLKNTLENSILINAKFEEFQMRTQPQQMETDNDYIRMRELAGLR